MQNTIELIEKIINEETIIKATFSGIRKKSEKTFNKVTIKKVIIQNEEKHQFEYFYDKNVEHKNLNNNDSIAEMCKLLETYFKQAVINTIDSDYQILISKKGKAKILKKAATRKFEEASHNRKKKYILNEGELTPFLIELGIMSAQGKIVNSKYDKFKQINRYLELVSDCIPYLDKNKTIRIIDFGCGKAYLTFALYDYLVLKMGYNVEIVGLDLKENVIKFCSDLAQKLNYDDLRFEQGDIKGFNQFTNVDMVISLHACNTATDEALAKAVNWGAQVILAVPCCQHEFLKKIKNEKMIPMMKYGIIKEKLASLLTDSVRANVLEIMGYRTQVLEFIDMEHTPKNIMIRAFFDKTPNTKKVVNQYKQFKNEWQISPYIEEAFGKKLTDKLN
ncbi:MAG: SAM-dependent methyltransferase [Campylobacteraceae bacterium]|jgi:SAM-dependent methyltransferase|nr:SAM-dependent methyltransferase [Campylobacteraceae bacterium]MBT3881789.1 SAM-dependent methyltransferase [Campylobacteraceae bacterium]MBT4031032.1 SAM-dependent methyltransferase [Campylobacteraceae bacterium]MBT4179766.1 SAM-dependent methyltransferase [Campylobacteraceae bacterium]MBT4573073.1 SAM-dependent methyltransferase [Campylobacteraceae bacterium]